MIVYKAAEAFRFVLQELQTCFLLMIRHKQLGMVKQLGVFDLGGEKGLYGFEKRNFLPGSSKAVKDEFFIKKGPVPVTALK